MDFELDRDLELIEELEELQPHKKIPRVNLFDAKNPLEYYNAKSFYDNMAFTKDQFLIVLDKFKHKFASSMPIHSPLVQFTVFLSYVKSNSFLRVLGTQACVQLPVATCHEIVNSVAMDIASYTRAYIVYPTVEEQTVIAARILDKYGFPGSVCILHSSEIRDLSSLKCSSKII